LGGFYVLIKGIVDVEALSSNPFKAFLLVLVGPDFLHHAKRHENVGDVVEPPCLGLKAVVNLLREKVCYLICSQKTLTRLGLRNKELQKHNRKHTQTLVLLSLARNQALLKTFWHSVCLD
jgi:hypothetical protein